MVNPELPDDISRTEMLLLRDFHQAWVSFHALPRENSKMSNREKAECFRVLSMASQHMIDCADSLQNLYQPMAPDAPPKTTILRLPN